MKTILALSLVALFAATSALAGGSLGDTCKSTIIYDLGQKGLDVRALELVDAELGTNSDTLKIRALARDPSGDLVTLGLIASGSASEDGVCRVLSVRSANHGR
jgi:hypothetical protein